MLSLQIYIIIDGGIPQALGLARQTFTAGDKGEKEAGRTTQHNGEMGKQR